MVNHKRAMIFMAVCLVVMLVLPPLLVWAADEVAPAAPAAAHRRYRHS